ncbi:hypothetical protein [Oxynema aestuarii]|uniref:Uncharacterized protein n=1 Tax=Oxynema aestuarii AP17 TaxID=2064643 RepID=A0A6H1TXB5_9CYAN|nr:hypothetical protein [Oxynema aestuarii]QIZ70787.1 hypothetical protein HCG48_09475 [Oxynema aestuarii AP17]
MSGRQAGLTALPIAQFARSQEARSHRGVRPCLTGDRAVYLRRSPPGTEIALVLQCKNRTFPNEQIR